MGKGIHLYNGRTNTEGQLFEICISLITTNDTINRLLILPLQRNKRCTIKAAKARVPYVSYAWENLTSTGGTKSKTRKEI